MPARDSRIEVTDPLPEYGTGVVEIFQAALTNSIGQSAYIEELCHLLGKWDNPKGKGINLSALPVLACQAAGGDPSTARLIAAAWHSVRLGLKLLDDMEDGDAMPSSIHINAATGLLFAAQLVLASLPEKQAWQITLELEHALLQTGVGQHADLVAAQPETSIVEPETWLQIALAKSGNLFGWAAWAGAFSLDASEELQSHYCEYGSHLGVLLQVADDFNGIWGPGDSNDLVSGHLNLAVCYGRYVTSGDRTPSLNTLLQAAFEGDASAKLDVQKLLIELGAQAYLLAVARIQYDRAIAAIQRTQAAPSAETQLVDLLKQVFPAINSVDS